MLKFILRRILLAIPVLIGITLFNFFIINLAPGNPVEMFINPSMSQTDIELRKEQLGINDPIAIQYFRWLVNLLHGDFGYSYSSFEPVAKMVSSRIGPTFLLMGSSLLIAYLVAVPIGILSARKQYSWLDYTATSFSFLGVSIPNFILGLVGIYVFSLTLKWLPTSGMYTLGKNETIGDLLLHMIMPACILATASAGSMVRYVRSSVLEVLGQDYLRTARAKGISEFVVMNRHALRNAMIPIITVVGLDVPLLFGGAVVTEQVFGWPGMGQLMIQSIGSRDYPTLMAINLIAAVAVLLANLLTDIAYAVADPSIKYSKG
ncbi:peptide ABC transporter permease [Paenibacillus antibioticophila]|uniref:Peptide ABC transporter permease n=1 Tax=Paenibacillus antibioticophila TaxID=1274374 RepID=A0A920CID8_9BACL|nr:ABC transporter permease [Paenibacillus antibioticophila]GIO38653.1 peptide ABC transporter permease [Paenibacillus antibioticophila]